MSFLRRAVRHVAAWRQRLSRQAWILLGIGAVTATISTGLVALAPEPDRRPAAELVVPVTTVVAEVKSHAPEVGLYGRIETPNAARLTALVSATVASLAVREGDRVLAGDVLVRLDQTDAKLAARRGESDLTEAEADLEALKLAGADDRAVLAHQEELHRLAREKADWHRQLRAQGAISQQTLNAAQSDAHAQAIALSRQRHEVSSFNHRLARVEARLARAAASLEEARVALQRTQIRAPFPGRVTSIRVAPGELVSPGSVVAEIYDDSALEVRAQIPNAHLPVLESALARGERPPAEVVLGGDRVQGELDRLVGAVAEGQSGVDGLVRLAADAAPPELGRAVDLRITLPPVPNAVAVPVQAVYGQRRLFVIEDGLLVGIEVERLGGMTDAAGRMALLVRSPALANGTRVLTSRLSNAVTGLRVSYATGEEGQEDRDAA